MSDYVIENTNKIFLDTCPYVQFEENEALIDLGIDSISFVKIVIKLENFFEIKFNDEDLTYDNFETLEDIYNYIFEKIKM